MHTAMQLAMSCHCLCGTCLAYIFVPDFTPSITRDPASHHIPNRIILEIDDLRPSLAKQVLPTHKIIIFGKHH
jgi:hypothetical protein